jgi:hypothetical protein
MASCDAILGAKLRFAGCLDLDRDTDIGRAVAVDLPKQKGETLL